VLSAFACLFLFPCFSLRACVSWECFRLSAPPQSRITSRAWHWLADEFSSDRFFFRAVSRVSALQFLDFSPLLVCFFSYVILTRLGRLAHRLLCAMACFFSTRISGFLFGRPAWGFLFFIAPLLEPGPLSISLLRKDWDFSQRSSPIFLDPTHYAQMLIGGFDLFFIPQSPSHE